jgi:hypothetical protein
MRTASLTQIYTKAVSEENKDEISYTSIPPAMYARLEEYVTKKGINKQTLLHYAFVI